MSKTIIYQKIDADKFTPQQAYGFHKMVRDALPEEYILITTPTEITKIDGETPVIMIEARQYTANELMKILEAVEK